MNLGLNTVSQTDTCFSLNTDSSTVRRLSLLRYNYQTMSSATFCQLARSWRKRFHFQHSCTRPLPPDMVHCRRLPSPHSIMMLHAESKPNKLPTLRNLALCLAECRHSTNRYTQLLCFTVSQYRVSVFLLLALGYASLHVKLQHQDRHFPEQCT